MGDVLRRLRDALRPAGVRDLWIGDAPSKEEIEIRLAGDEEARHVLFDWSMAEFVERYLTDDRLQMRYLGQGVIGTNASPFIPELRPSGFITRQGGSVDHRQLGDT